MGALLEKLRGSTRKDDRSLTEQVDSVSTAFREAVRGSTPQVTDWSSCWVSDVYDDHVIARVGEDYYSVPYTTDDQGDFTFDMEAATEVERTWTEVSKRFRISKTDPERQLVFGWAYVAEDTAGERVVDHSGEYIAKEDLEDAAYVFNLEFREGDERHTDEVKTHLVESFVVTPEKLEKMGLAEDALPCGWWTGWYVPDAELFAKVRDGEYEALSIGGFGEKVSDAA